VYVAVTAFMPLLVAPIIALTVFIVTFYILYMPPLLSIVFTVVSFIISYAIVFMLLYIVPVMMFSSRAPQLEKSLVVLYAYLAALGVSGTSYTEALRKLWEKSESLGAEPELTEVVKRVYILGEDVVEVLKNVAETAPQRDFGNFLRGLANVIESGAGLENFAEVGFETALANMQAKMKEAMGALEIMSEMYVTGAAVMPILALSFAVVLATMGPSAKMFGLALPVAPGTLAGLMAFFGIPLLSIFAILMVDGTLSKIRGW
jgi:archaellum biogenesis protein FlaJ (TadC family)